MHMTAEHEDISRTTTRFVADEIQPCLAEWEEAGHLPLHDIFGGLAELGLLGIAKAESQGGLGLDASFQFCFAEALGSSLAGRLAAAVAEQTDRATPALARFGSDELQEEFLQPAVAGEQVAMLAAPSSSQGTQGQGIQARIDGGDYLLHGRSGWIAHAAQADWACVWAREESSAGGSLILLPLECPGVEREEWTESRYQPAWGRARLHLEGVRVERSFLIGESGQALSYLQLQALEEHIFRAASLLGGAQRLLQHSLEAARSDSFAASASAQYTLSLYATQLAAAQSLAHQACAGLLAGQDVRLLSAMARYQASALAWSLSDACQGLWASLHSPLWTGLQSFHRDLRWSASEGHAGQDLLSLIAAQLGLGPESSELHHDLA